MTNVSQSMPHIMAGKQPAQIWYEEITSLLPYVLVTHRRRAGVDEIINI